MISAVANPELDKLKTRPVDAVVRAMDIVDEVKSLGAYSNHKGIAGIRRRFGERCGSEIESTPIRKQSF